MESLMLGALLAGLLGSPHCVAMCGAFACATADRVDTAVAYHLGRLGTYAALGALAGAFGAVLPGPGWVVTVLAGVLVTWFALALAGLVRAPEVAVPGVARLAAAASRRPGPLGRLAFGAVTGLVPCGLVYTAIGLPVALANPTQGALAMALFGVGTVPMLAGASLGLRRIVATRLWARRAMAALVLASGWWSLGVREGLLGGHSATAEQQEPVCH